MLLVHPSRNITLRGKQRSLAVNLPYHGWYWYVFFFWTERKGKPKTTTWAMPKPMFFCGCSGSNAAARAAYETCVAKCNNPWRTGPHRQRKFSWSQRHKLKPGAECVIPRMLFVAHKIGESTLRISKSFSGGIVSLFNIILLHTLVFLIWSDMKKYLFDTSTKV